MNDDRTSNFLIDLVKDREPDLIIGDPKDPYLLRWWLKRDRNKCSVYLHNVLKDDDDRALHDHPWSNSSFILEGILREITEDGERYLYPGTVTHREDPEFAHRLEIVQGPVWSLFMTGPNVRDWGFLCPQGWVPWWEFVDPNNPGLPGPGCGEEV